MKVGSVSRPSDVKCALQGCRGSREGAGVGDQTLLLDEPLSNVDAATKFDIATHMRSFFRNSKFLSFS